MRQNRFTVQGAAEIVLKRCEAVVDASGAAVPLTDDTRTELMASITRMASTGLRTLCLAYRDFGPAADRAPDFFDFPPDELMTACCLVGIKVLAQPAVLFSLRALHPFLSVILTALRSCGLILT